jgi:hypothetical protein
MGTIRRLCEALWQLCDMQGHAQRQVDLRGMDYCAAEMYFPPFQFRGIQDEHSDYLGFANMPQEYADESV